MAFPRVFHDNTIESVGQRHWSARGRASDLLCVELNRVGQVLGGRRISKSLYWTDSTSQQHQLDKAFTSIPRCKRKCSVSDSTSSYISQSTAYWPSFFGSYHLFCNPPVVPTNNRRTGSTKPSFRPRLSVDFQTLCRKSRTFPEVLNHSCSDRQILGSPFRCLPWWNLL